MKASNNGTACSAYVYPNISIGMMGSGNPYVDRLKKALQEQGIQVDPSTTGNAFADLVKKGFGVDFIIFNWLEDLPSRRMGLLQSFLLMGYILLLKGRGVKIIWIKHNKVSHAQKWFRVRQMIQRFLSRHADHIVTHATDEETSGLKKTVFFPHPCTVEPADILHPQGAGQPDIDLLIWGSLLPYKGVLEFLQFVEKDAFLRTLNIHIVGKCSPAYWSQLIGHRSENVHLSNEFIEEEQLRRLFKRTRFILFTYNKKSILSSGVLMDSLVACKKMIAPDCGAFRDMADQQGFVSLFADWSDIAGIYKQDINNFNLDYEQVCEFVAQNSWYQMAGRIRQLILPPPPQPTLSVGHSCSEPSEINS